MVRKDKITYLITHFNSFGRNYDYPNETFFECMIRTILSQNTSDLNRDRAYHTLMDRYSDIDSVYNASISDIEELIKVGGPGCIQINILKIYIALLKNMEFWYALTRYKPVFIEWESYMVI